MIEPVGDETVVYDLESKDAHCLKPVAAFVFGHCDGRRTVGEIAALARVRFESVSDEEIFSAVAELEVAALLEAPPQLDDELVVVASGMRRRDMLRRMAFAGAAATATSALITTIAAPTALAATSGQPAGCTCTQNKDCATNHCCGHGGTGEPCNVGCCSAGSNNGGDCACNANHTCTTIVVGGACTLGICSQTPTC